MLLGLGILSSCSPAPSPPAAHLTAGADQQFIGIEEASGVVRDGDRLLIVGDHEPGTYYTAELSPDDPAPAGDDPPGRIPLGKSRLTRHRIPAGDYAMDLESIEVLTDGRVVLLSERLGALVDAEGLVAVYGSGFAELGGRGAEGLAARPMPGGTSRVAVLWEGGYPVGPSTPTGARAFLDGHALKPRVIVHDIAPGERGIGLDPDQAAVDVELQVPVPPGVEPSAQRFRAPDLVWHRLDGDEWGFLVLLSSGYEALSTPGPAELCPKEIAGKPLRWCYKWLQRFRVDGTPVGEPLDLDDVLPEVIRHENWEGMDWFEEGRSVVLVFDERVSRRKVDPQVAWVVELPESW